MNKQRLLAPRNAAAHLFRRGSLVSEKDFELDLDLVKKMIELRIRVQDLLDYIILGDPDEVKPEIDVLLGWYNADRICERVKVT